MKIQAKHETYHAFPLVHLIAHEVDTGTTVTTGAVADSIVCSAPVSTLALSTPAHVQLSVKENTYVPPCTRPVAVQEFALRLFTALLQKEAEKVFEVEATPLDTACTFCCTDQEANAQPSPPEHEDNPGVQDTIADPASAVFAVAFTSVGGVAFTACRKKSDCNTVIQRRK